MDIQKDTSYREGERMSEAMHDYFSLSYANYLVLPRTVFQSMPDKWHEDFVTLLNRLPPLFGDSWEPNGGYRVLALDGDKKFTKDPYSNYERGRRRLPRI